MTWLNGQRGTHQTKMNEGLGLKGYLFSKQSLLASHWLRPVCYLKKEVEKSRNQVNKTRVSTLETFIPHPLQSHVVCCRSSILGSTFFWCIHAPNSFASSRNTIALAISMQVTQLYLPAESLSNTTLESPPTALARWTLEWWVSLQLSGSKTEGVLFGLAALEPNVHIRERSLTNLEAAKFKSVRSFNELKEWL